MNTRDPRFDILFESVQIGPVKTKNRFYQVPHCNGMGHGKPQSLAAMRGVKAEGGWGVVCTEEIEISPYSETAPYMEGRLWDERDIPALRLMTDACHAHGALAGAELFFNGYATANRYSREIPMAPSHTPVKANDPIQARTMDKRDIANVRRWHRNAALRARDAGFDLVYVYAGHDLGLPMHFLSRRTNRRTDEYGGSLENRVRFLRELIEDTKDAVGDRCGVVVRLAVDQLLGPLGITSANEGRDVIALLAELPDLWDVNIADWSNDSQTARFSQEGYQEQYIAHVKQLTTKPVVGVGRYTSPDAMVSAIKRGVMDLIGAARPSIADPFLPAKVEQGRMDEIRECIGCNICVTGDNLCVPIRCTQNPTMGEEWRKGWHPERIATAQSKDSVLVVGAGPAGLELARALGQRGYEVALADAGKRVGGRLLNDAALPGLSTWMRVADWRMQRIQTMSNVNLYLDSRLTADDVLVFGFNRVFVATGSTWRKDGLGRQHRAPLIDTADAALAPRIFTPDDVFSGAAIASPVMVYDDDHYYMGGAIAEQLRRRGLEVHLVTPSVKVSEFTDMTMEQHRIQSGLHKLGVQIRTNAEVAAIQTDGAGLAVELCDVYSDARTTLRCASVVMVTMRDPADALYVQLQAREADWPTAGIRSVQVLGDAYAPGTVAAAVYAGHRAARELDAPALPLDTVPFQREFIRIGEATR
ncbi:FAD-dependent oxidoreductase [Rhodoferax sp. GW822-FHT02A01]|uniref:oxidoreductase n=1 Tax=Rhodoferax sp. GW822-FHT02A01 TaxID=3141537 RepID=UPI00315D065E